jgi:hypothetical protein
LLLPYEDLADVSLRLGRFVDAVTYSREAIDHITATHGRNTFRQRLPWKQLAEALNGLHRNQDALEAALESERVRRDAQAALMAGLTERNALLSSLSTSSSLNVLVSLAGPMRDDSSAVRQIWDAVIRSRASVLDLTAERGQISRRAGDAQLSILAERLTRAREDLARALVRGSGSLDAKQYAERLRNLNSEEEKAEVDLASESAPFLQQETQRRAGLSEVAAALPAGIWRTCASIPCPAQERNRGLSCGSGTNSMARAQM